MPNTTSATGSTAIAIPVVVPACGRMDRLDRCLDALTRQTLPGGSVEVIVVDEPKHNTLRLVAGWRARPIERGPRLPYLANSGRSGHGDADLHFRLLGMQERIAHAPGAVVVQPVPPTPWGASLAQTCRAALDALLHKKHPQLYREKIGATPPPGHYLAALALVGARAALPAGATTRRPDPHAPHAAGPYARGRYAGGPYARGPHAGSPYAGSPYSRPPNTVLHMLDMIVTPALVPALAVCWRLVGTIRYRVRLT